MATLEQVTVFKVPCTVCNPVFQGSLAKLNGICPRCVHTLPQVPLEVPRAKPKGKNYPRTDLPKLPCKGCEKKYTQKGLDSNGMCSQCSLEAQCQNCQRTVSQKSLDKNNGLCSKCCNPPVRASQPKEKKGPSEKEPCSVCGNRFTVKTLEKYNGMCGRCEKKTIRLD